MCQLEEEQVSPKQLDDFIGTGGKNNSPFHPRICRSWVDESCDGSRFKNRNQKKLFKLDGQIKKPKGGK
ncbi:hypothetical protein A2924_02455 [Candidatus Giovannonibacteria bacterium RIFCSPLOWO2_01_FULL_44_16]|uniref:Uncharacterized protein n=1 Tax=Candidatus Giovannonibacteria bacterium RIFCSPLOWO2_01_FULL_44_16 TaxID=1798348 RepID=A0A1F5X108_9BACT|nr:MAG: hypothetical protein A2924_02455 [Candidatus Giovannonibacteria bacterium RIFCSPLOWO2_01_FULL_44_16]